MAEIKREKKGTFVKGQSGNPGGKPKGVSHKTAAEIRTALQGVFSEGVDKLQAELAKLKGMQFVNAMLALAKFILPPLAPESTDATETNPYHHPVTKIELPVEKEEATNESKDA